VLVAAIHEGSVAQLEIDADSQLDSDHRPLVLKY